ncbi:MAG: addiction module protein [Actinomycetes bacterium]
MGPSARASLARELLASLDDLSAVEVEQLWLKEAVRRTEEMASGKVRPIPMLDSPPSPTMGRVKMRTSTSPGPLPSMTAPRERHPRVAKAAPTIVTLARVRA